MIIEYIQNIYELFFFNTNLINELLLSEWTLIG